MNTLFIGAGSNLPDRLSFLVSGLDALQKRSFLVESVSSVYLTEPVECRDGNEFLNCAARLRTPLSPEDCLKELLGAESDLGRKRPYLNAPRELDLDILLYGDTIVHSPELRIPHPELSRRRFVLEPLCEIAPDLVHPVLKQSITNLLHACQDPHRVELYCKWPGFSL